MVATWRYPKKIDDGNLVLECLLQPSIVGGIRIRAHESVIDCLITLEYLMMDIPLIVIPDFPARLRENRLDGQQEAHLLRFKDAALRIN